MATPHSSHSGSRTLARSRWHRLALLASAGCCSSACALDGTGLGLRSDWELGTSTALSFQPGAVDDPETSTADDEDSARAPIAWNVAVTGLHAFESDLKDGPGSLSLTRAGVRLGAAVPIDRTVRWTLGVDFETAIYDFEDATTALSTGAVVGDPVGHVAEIRLATGVLVTNPDGFSWTIGGFVGFSGETDADADDAFIAGVLGGASWQVSETMRLGFFASARNSLDDEDILWFAIPAVDWRIADRWRLSTGLDGLLTLGYDVSDTLTATLDTGYEQNQYRLSEDGLVPGGAFTDRRIPVALGLRAAIGPRSYIRVRAGAYVWTDMEITDSSGDELGSSETDPTGFLGLTVSVSF